MEADGYHPRPEQPVAGVKRGRGRPRKNKPEATPYLEEDAGIQTRSQSKQAAEMIGAVDALFRTPSLTLSPTKKASILLKNIASCAEIIDFSGSA